MSWRSIPVLAPSAESPGRGEVYMAGGQGPSGRRTLQVPTTDDYSARLLKLVPAEVTSAYALLDSIAASPESGMLRWLVFWFCLLAAPLYLIRVNGVRGRQVLISACAFAVWALVLGGPFERLEWYSQQFASALLVAYTFAVPMFWTSKSKVRQRSE